MTDTTRIVIADDHPLVREGLKRLISREPDFEFGGEAENGLETIERCRQGDVDVLILDITMPGPGFTEVLARLRALRPSPAILILSMHPEDKYATRALRAGANGYLTKGQSPRVLADAIRTVAAGGTYVSADLASTIVAELKGEAPGLPHEALSRREFQVLQKLGSGKTLAEIAAELSLSPKTISTYRTRVLEKLGLRRTADLIRYAVENELVE